MRDDSPWALFARAVTRDSWSRYGWQHAAAANIKKKKLWTGRKILKMKATFSQIYRSQATAAQDTVSTIYRDL